MGKLRCFSILVVALLLLNGCSLGQGTDRSVVESPAETTDAPSATAVSVSPPATGVPKQPTEQPTALPVATPSEELTPPTAPAGDGTVRGWAVLAEKDDYSDVEMTDLPVDYAGVTQMRGVLERSGWQPDGIREVREFDRGSLQHNLDWLADNADGDDVVFLYVAAHGRYLSHILVWDAFFPADWQEIPSQRRLLVIDSCQAANYTAAISGDPGPYLSIAAVAGDEYAWSGLEEEGLPIIGGVFTHYFAAALGDSGADADGDGYVSAQEAALVAEGQQRTYMHNTVFAVPEFVEMYHESGVYPDKDPTFPDVVIDDTLDEPLYLDLAAYEAGAPPLPTVALRDSDIVMEGESESELVITYSSNAGFVIASGDKKIVVDALYDGFGGRRIPAERRKLMEEALPPYDSVALILNTHVHDDHFDPDIVGAHLQSNPSAVFVSTARGALIIRGRFSTLERLDERVFGIRLSTGASQRLEVNGTDLQVLHISHGEGADVQNHGYIFTIGGYKIFHTGDIGAASYLHGHDIPAEQIDFAFVPWFFLTEPENHEAIAQDIQARFYIPMHFHYTMDSVDSIQEQVEAGYPEAILFREEMQRLVVR